MLPPVKITISRKETIMTAVMAELLQVFVIYAPAGQSKSVRIKSYRQRVVSGRLNAGRM